MADFFNKYREEFNKIWGKLNNNVKIIIIVSTVLLAAGFGYLIVRGSTSNYKPLYTDLTTGDTAAIVEKLKEDQVDYKLSGNGSTIMVPEEQLHQLRIELAGAGLPDQGVVGFEIFDSSQFGTTEFERKVNYYRALGGELSRSIQSISGISYSRVQITPPEQSLFIAEEKSATASVLIDLEPGFKMSPETVASIQNLVASSVQDLPLSQVTVVDTNGNLLSIDGETDGNSWISDPKNFTLQKNFEKSLKTDLSAMLTKVLGPGNFTVQVYAKLNFDQRQTESKTYSPVVDEDGIVRSQESNTESYEGSNGGPAAGTPGTDSNIPQYQAEGSENTGSYEKENIITNYEINEKIEKHVYAPGEIKKLSVSVMVNQDADEETLEQIRNAVQAAIGYDEERGDVVDITAIRFDNSLEEAAAQARAAEEAAARRQTYIYAGLIILILVITAALVVYLYRKQKTAPAGSGVDISVEEESEELDLLKKSPEEKEKEQVKKELERMVNSDPESAAKLIRSWLVDE